MQYLLLRERWLLLWACRLCTAGAACSLHSKTHCSMFSHTTMQAQIWEPTFSISRALSSLPCKALFSLETSCPFCCWGIRQAGGKVGDDSPRGYVVYPIGYCINKAQRLLTLIPFSQRFSIGFQEESAERASVKAFILLEQQQSRPEIPPHSAAVVWLSPWLLWRCLPICRHLQWAYFSTSWHSRGVYLIKLLNS